jgi:hypothetical protein
LSIDPENNLNTRCRRLCSLGGLGISPLATAFSHGRKDHGTSPIPTPCDHQPLDAEQEAALSGKAMTLATPRFDAHGYLEAGVHHCTFQELESLLGWNESRRHLLRQLQQFIAERLVPEFSLPPPLVLDGRFVTKHEHPKEIVAVILMDELGEDSFWSAAELYQHHEALRSRYQVRLFVHTDTSGINALARIQGIDPSELLEKNLYHQHTKGVVRLH